MRYNEEYEEHHKDIEQIQRGEMDPDTWFIHEGRPLIQIVDKDLLSIIKNFKAIRLRDFFDRFDTEEGPVFSNLLEVTAFIDEKRIWSLVWIKEDFLLALDEHKVIRFGNSDNFTELPIHEISDLENMRNNWNFYRNDDEWFKSKRNS